MIFQQKRIGLYYGSFNPIHLGHIALAQYALEHLPIDSLWLVLSPLNPQKNILEQLPYHYRCHLIERSIEAIEGLELCTIESELPTPHYTIRSLRALNMLYPKCDFSLLIGADTLINLPSWYESERIMRNTPLYIYPRPGYQTDASIWGGRARVHLLHNVPESNLSSSLIRKAIESGLCLEYALPIPGEWEELSRQFTLLKSK